MLAHDVRQACGRPAVFLHALLGRRELMADMAEDWRRTRGTTVLIDLPGHGESDMPEVPIAIESTAQAVREVIGAAGVERPVLLGHSMGGLIALEVAAQRADAASAVILLDPAPIVLDPETRNSWSVLQEMLDGESFDEAKQILIDAQSGPHDDPGAVSRRAEIFHGIARNALVQSFASMLAWDGTGALARVHVPVAGIWSGWNDEPDALLAARPDALVGKVVGSGHYVQAEAGTQVAAMIERCLNVWGLA